MMRVITYEMVNWRYRGLGVDAGNMSDVAIKKHNIDNAPVNNAGHYEKMTPRLKWPYCSSFSSACSILKR